jgi:hypothetical protein
MTAVLIPPSALLHSDLAVYWGELVFGRDVPVSGFSGWFGLPGAEYEDAGSGTGHGVPASPGAHGARYVVLEGYLLPGDRATGMRQLAEAFIPKASHDASLEPLTVTADGHTSTAQVQLQRFDFLTEPKTWGSGLIGWRAVWKSPNPRKFGDPATYSAPLVSLAGGLVLPTPLPIGLPARQVGGEVTVYNPGNDPEGSPMVVDLVGGQNGMPGVQVVKATGEITTCRFPFVLQANRGDGQPDTLTVDTESGGALLNGTAYRNATGDLVRDLRLSPGTNLVRALGTPGLGSPSITVTVTPWEWW